MKRNVFESRNSNIRNGMLDTDSRLNMGNGFVDYSNNMIFNGGLIEKKLGESKRNSNVLQTGANVNTIFQYKKADGSSYELIACGTDIYKYNSTTSQYDSIKSSLTTGKVTNMLTFNNYCYMQNDTDQPMRFDGTNIYRWGIAAPAKPTETVTAHGSATDPTGDFYYKITYYNSNTTTESNASPTSDISQPATNDKVVVSWAASTDPQVTHVRIYRTENGGTDFYYLGQVAIGTTNFTDTYADASLQLTTPAPTENDPCPTGLVSIIAYKERLWGVKGSTLYYTSSSNEESWDVDSRYFLINNEDGDTLTGGVAISFKGDTKIYNKLLIFKNKSTHVLSGSSDSDFAMDIVSGSEGCVASRSIIQKSGMVFFMSQDKINIFVDDKIVPISDPYINTFLATLNSDKKSSSFAIFDEKENSYKLWVCTGANTTADTCLIYRMGQSEGGGGAWYIDNGFTCNAAGNISNEIKIGGLGYVYNTKTTYQKSGTNFEAYITTKNDNLGTTKNKQFLYCDLWIDCTADCTITGEYTIDDNPIPVSISQAHETTSEARIGYLILGEGTLGGLINYKQPVKIELNGIGQRIKFKFACSDNTAAFKIVGWDIYAKGMGRGN